MKVKIIRLSKKDAFYGQRKELVGLTGKWTDLAGLREGGWYGGNFVFDSVPNGNGWRGISTLCFAYVKFEVLEK